MAGIAVALDFSDAEDALALVDRLEGEGDVFKIGVELFTRAGPDVVRAVRDRGGRVFLDLKLHDIPHTVSRAVTAAASHGVELLTVHASGGLRMLGAAAEAAAAAGASDGAEGPVRLLGVTVLTSLSGGDLADTWGRAGVSVEEEVLRLGSRAVEAGLDGLVASALETEALRRTLGDGILLVTPGIRLADGDHHDQTRVATPGGAVRAGSDLLVVGRAVTGADDPLGALRSIRREADAATAPAGGDS